MKRILLVVIVSLGCAACGGMELGGRLGVYRVDERQESQRTYQKPTPLKCFFMNCPAESEVQGS